ncbi:hypothetical protein CesoFtcFv8_014408 [Champsocephalus esox]|nr:hypothetical protein CesoFtcFv8_014408 [Champsocephalus esox]
MVFGAGRTSVVVGFMPSSEVPIVQGVQLRILKSNGCLCPYPGLDMDPQNMLLQRSKCWRELVTLCPVFAEEMPS